MREIYNKRIPGVKELSLNENSPFLINALIGDENHRLSMVNTIFAMIALRHLGFPSPILDWTINYHVATFFAFVNENVSEKAIFCIKRNRSGQTFEENKIDLFTPQIQHYRPEDFHKQEDGELIRSLPRHCRQESVYTLQMYNNQNEYYREENDDPFFCLSHMADPRYILEKYIIKNSREKRLAIIDSLYRKGITYECIYEKRHPSENTQLSDIAITKLLLVNYFYISS